MQTAYTREAYGQEIVKLGGENPDIVVLEADISTSTKTCYFAKAFPERFFNVGVAEQNEAIVAAGLASTGLIPFLSTYAVFASMRACEQVRTFICYPNLNVKIAVSHGGITPCTDGVTHQATEDLAIMRVMPNMSVIAPTDYNMTKAAVRAAAEHYGPVYIRLTRDPLPIIYEENVAFKIGKAFKLYDGNDVTIISVGDMTYTAIKARDALKNQGISAALIDMPTIKPIDGQAIINAARSTGAIVTVEDHQIIGGLGSAVAEVLGENYPIPLKRIGLADTFAESGEYELLLDKYGMSSKHIAEAAKNVIKMKR
ncbi:MAG: transketolase family protein [Actinobacteria bacterium]|nr:transketolase family protein [Actinomycetota bacterium]